MSDDDATIFASVAKAFGHMPGNVQREIAALLETGARLYTIATDELQSQERRSAARLQLFKLNLAEKFFPFVYPIEVMEGIRDIYLSSSQEDLDASIKALERVIKLCTDDLVDLEAYLRGRLAGELIIRSGHLGDPDQLSAAHHHATRAVELSRRLPNLAIEEKLEILFVALDANAARGGAPVADRSDLCETYCQHVLAFADDPALSPPVKAMAYHNVATHLASDRSKTALRKARELFQQAASIYSETLGQGHPLTGSTIGGLIQVERSLYESTLDPSFEPAVELGEACWHAAGESGEANPRLMAVLSGALSNAFRDKRDGDILANMDRALYFAETTVRLVTEALGAYSAEAMKALHNLATICHLADSKRHPDRVMRARHILTKALRDSARMGIHEDPEMESAALDELANIIADNAAGTSELEEAIAYHKRAVQLLSAGTESPEGVRTRQQFSTRLNLGLTLSKRAFIEIDDGIVEGASLVASQEVFSEVITSLRDTDQDEDLLTTAAGSWIINSLRGRIHWGQEHDDETWLEELVVQYLASAPHSLSLRQQVSEESMIGLLFGSLGHHAQAAVFLARAANAATSMYAEAASLETRTKVVVDAGTTAIEAAWHLALSGSVQDSKQLLNNSRARWLRDTLRLRLLNVEAVDQASPDLGQQLAQAVREVRRVEQLEVVQSSSLSVRGALPAAGEDDRDRLAQAQRARRTLERVLGEIETQGILDAPGLWPAADRRRPGVAVLHVAAAYGGTLGLLEHPDGHVESFSDSTLTHADVVRLIDAWDTGLTRLRTLGPSGLLNCIAKMRGLLPALFDWLGTSLTARGIDSLAIIPCGGLSFLPFHAFGSPPLAEVYDVSYLPASDLFFGSRHHPTPTPSGVDGTRYAGFADQSLAFAEAEVAASAMALNGRRTAVKSLDASSNLLDQLRDASVVHFACHGAYDRSDPAQSRLHLGAFGELNFASLIGQQPLSSCECVILAACESATSRRLVDENLSMATGFLFAGANLVLGCMWPVDDLVSFLVVTRWCAELASGATPARALRIAVSWLSSLSKSEVLKYIAEITAAAGTAEVTIHRMLSQAENHLPAGDRPFTEADAAAFVLVGDTSSATY